MAAGKIARRVFLIGAASVAGGFAVGAFVYLRPYPNPMRPDAAKGEATLTPYVWIDQSGVTVIAPRAEMGQGVHTTLAALVAEELDLDWDQVRVAHGPPSHAYFNAGALSEGLPFPPTDTGWLAETSRSAMDVPGKILGIQVTGGSSSIPDAYRKMRQAGATARAMLVAAAASQFGVPASDLKTESGHVIAPDGRKVSYAELATLAATQDVGDVAPKDRADWRLLGRPLPRLDVVAKSTGTAQFGMDVQLPGMVYATIRTNPRIGGPMNSYDAAEAEAMDGTLKVVPIGNGVAVIGKTTWHAFRAAEVITFDWGAAPYPPTTDEHFAAIAAAFDGGRDSRLRNDGDVDNALTGEGVIEAEYRAPYLAHATMETMNCTAWLHDGQLELWAGTQVPTIAVTRAAKLTGLDEDKITLTVPYLGGGFGRRLEIDFIEQAVQVAMAMEGTPVKSVWTRVEDTTHDMYRPAAMARFRARVEGGKAVAADLKVAAGSQLAGQLRRWGYPAMGPDPTIVQAAWDQPYAIPNYRVAAYRAPDLLPVGSWRSVGASQNGFFHDSMIDEMAYAAGADPMAFRLAHLSDEPSRKVLEAVAERSGWGTPLPPGRARGCAFVLSFGVPAAEVVEIAETEQGLRVSRVWAAVDVGIALDPRNIEAQVMSGINYGLSAAILGEITLADGMVEQGNFSDQDVLRLYQSPEIDVTILENAPHIRGIGEPGLPPVIPALGNAVFALNGNRLRELPFGKHIAFA